MIAPIDDGSRGKAALRRTALARRDAMPAADRAAAAAHITDATLAALARRVAPGSIVALYAAKGSEVPTAALDAAARAAGFALVYPRVVGAERQLAFHAVTRDELARGRFGLAEPLASSPTVALDAIAAIVVPGIAFDRGGGRLGWGRGHYDATLAAAPGAVRVGLAFECQVVDRVPRDPHDALLHVLVTEAT